MSPFASSAKALIQALQDQFALMPIIGFEREFYVYEGDAPATPSDAQWKALLDACAARGIDVEALKEEDGQGQYELCLRYVPAEEALLQYDGLHEVLHEWAETQALTLHFVPRVEEDQPSSALHVHLHVEEAGENIFTKNEDALSAPLAHSIAGLLELLPESMVLFAPDAVSYQRYREWEKYTPSKVAWGNNNRTTPIRLPAPEKPTPYRHIEHRVSASHADAYAVVTGVLAGVLYGLAHRPDLPECMFGDARERNHPELADLPKSVEEAFAAFASGEKLQGYLQAEAKEAINASTEAASASVA